MKVADRKKEIYELLEDTKVTTIVLHGKPGVGKTWTAREVSNVAKRNGLFDFVLWVYLNRNYDENTLSVSIAQQLSLLPTRGVSEVEEDDEEIQEKEEGLNPEALPKKVQEKKVLLIFDDEGDKMDESKIRLMLDNVLKQKYKVLITTRSNPDNVVITTTKEGDVKKIYKVEPMIRVESLALFKERVFPDHRLEGIDAFLEDFLGRTENMPSAIVMMAKVFKYFSNEGDLSLLRRSFQEPSGDKIFDITDLLRSGYDLVPYVILIDCQRDAKDKERPFFSDSRCINHNELITYWMMEGYLGHITCMDTAYRKGHEILMELLDFQILKRVEADYVTIDPLKEEFDEFILRSASEFFRRGYYSHACLGLDNVFDRVDWKGLVRISHKGGVMRTLPSGKGGKKVSALVLDGNSLAKDLPSQSISSLRKLQVLAIFNPTLDMLSPLKDIICLLHVFILRSCRFLKNLTHVHEIKEYENLTVLEISGPIDSSEKVEIFGLSTFKKFPDDFFERIPKLQSLNLSSLPIVRLPLSLCKLKELKWLILRDCTSLTVLSSLKDCTNLVVLDCSGSTSLENLQDRSFVNADLEMINLSDTKINILPLIGGLKKLTHLLLSKCSLLNRLRSIKDISSLEVIDLSNSGDFNEFFDKSLDKLVNLKVLDLSGTGVSTLPSDIGNPKHLCLENCTKLSGEGTPECLSKVKDLERLVLSNAGIKSLPSISHLTNLRQLSVTCCLDFEEVPDLSSLEKMEELDFSGCNSIKLIADKSFDKMSRLQKLNLSGTSIESLPSLVNLSNLRRLLLKDCKELQTLPSLESWFLEKLEELNVSGGKSLTKIDANFFDGTTNLHILDLSDTLLVELPSVLKLKNLRELYLRNCKVGLKSVLEFTTLTTLEILDLSGLAVSDLPFLSNLSKLRELMLGNCSSLSLFQKMRTLNVLGAPVQDLPYGISGLTSLERLELPSMDDFQEVQSDGCEWAILSVLVPEENRPSVSVSGTQFLQPLEKDPLLWESILKKFHLCVYPFKEVITKNLLRFHRDNFGYRDIYLTNRNIDESNDQRLLEISGFTDSKPNGIDTVVGHANQLFFVDNKFQEEGIIQTLASFFSACDSTQIKGCWIEKCREIEVIFSEKDIGKIIGLLISLETLSVSNATSLKSIFDIPKDSNSGKVSPKDEVFKKLQKVYLEYCPKISTVFSSTRLPEKLKTLQIRYCEKLEKVFDLSKEINLQYLETLHLWELPELKTVGCQFLSLKTLKISNSPNLQKLEETIESAKSLQNLSISNVSDLQKICVSKELKYLSIESCPSLLEIFSLSPPPSDLEIRIRFCNKLEIVFKEGTPLEIKSLYLHGLPKLKSIRARLPNKAVPVIIDCLNLTNDVE